MTNALPVVAVAVLAATVGCAAVPAAAPAPQAPPAAAASPELRIQAGESATVDAAGITITFVSVDGDSRCPKGETCIWEGSAAVRLEAASATGRQALMLHTSPRAGTDAATFDGWSIRLVALEPYPVAGRAIAPDAYVAVLHVEGGRQANAAPKK